MQQGACMADAFLELEQQDAARDLTHAEWLALLLDREIANRTTKRTQIRLRAARLRSRYGRRYRCDVGHG